MAITTPDRVDSRIGPLSFTDGHLPDLTARALRDELDCIHGVYRAYFGRLPHEARKSAFAGR